MLVRAVGYVRVSSEEQCREGISLDAQEEKVRAYATLKGFDLVQIFREEGVSAKTQLCQRPKGKKLCQMLAKKEATHIITIKLDRLFRNAEDALSQSSTWDKQSTALHIVDLGGSTIDTRSAVGRMFFTMMSGAAEMERNLTSERTKTALAYKKAEGKVYSRVPPLGYDRVGDDLVPNTKEMKTVKLIIDMREKGMGTPSIANALNESGAKTKLGGTWHPSTVAQVLKIHTS